MYKKTLIATFSVWKNGKRTAINGMVDAMLSYFLPKTERVDLIDGMHPGSSDVLSKIYLYKNSKLVSEKNSIVSNFLKPILKLQNTSATKIIFKIRDFLAVLEWVLRSKTKYDLFIGLESVYAIAGIFLKKIGFVKTVVYYVSDYSPHRYPQFLFNKIYVYLDKFCAKNADYTWDVSPEINLGRKQAGQRDDESSEVILVPNALFPSQINYSKIENLYPHSLVFAGTLGVENGPDIAVEAITRLIRKYPNVSLHIFGGNEEGKEDKLKRMCETLQIKKNIIFHGFIQNAELLTKTINRYMVGLAPYKKRKDSVRAFGDATKLRLYMGAGLPVITTDVPPLGKQLSKIGSALIVNDSPKDLAAAIDKLFSNRNLYISMREKAIEYAKGNTWENTYKNAFSKMRN
ncbi:MAG: glycosyltransferase [Candidatus Levybacteria bacterium]|nr:glycosyltransferase [Candidatus Levybacteria bacterium]